MPAGLDKETLDGVLAALTEFAGHHLPFEALMGFDVRDEFPEAIVRRMCGPELGIHLLFIPEEFNGMGGGAFDMYRLCEQMARIDLGIATGLFATFLGSDPIVVGGTPEQRRHWLTRIADEGLIMAYGATEPAAGSDLASLRTSAARIEADGAIVGYTITGRKQWISNGGVADVYTILADTPGGPSWFVVEKGAAGLSCGKPEDKHGIRASNTAAVYLEDVRVDADRLVGGVEGQGLQQAQAVFGYTRLMVAAFGLGAGWAALDAAIAYSRERIQAGGPLAEKQGYTHKLIVPHAVRLEMGRAVIEATAARIDGGAENQNTEGAIAKYLSSEAGNAACEAAIQALGGYGYTKEYQVEKHKRDVRITTIYEGTSEIMEMTISRDRWQLHLKTRGQYYHEQAKQMEALHRGSPAVGADIAALALHALAEVMERARLGKLTRNQHVLFRLGELIAHAEGAACLSHRAAQAAAGTLHTNAAPRFDAAALAILARIAAREVALKVAADGLRWTCGADALGAAELAGFESAAGVGAIHRVQVGLLSDMDRAADALYGRATR